MSNRSLTLGTTLEADREHVIRTLVVAHLEASYNLARLLVGDRALAEEATHDAVVSALGSSRQLRDLGAFEGWFRRILVRACRDVLRRRRRRPETLVAASPGWIAPDPGPAWAERDVIARALATLSEDHREVVVLRYFADLPVDKIARSLGIRAGTVKSRLHRALRQLRAEIDAVDRTDPETRR